MNPPIVLTYCSPDCDPPWIAIHRESALELLKDYDLTEEQKTDITLLMAGFCNVLDTAGLIFCGRTKAEATAKACGLKSKP